jgi:hypothetical protein
MLQDKTENFNKGQVNRMAKTTTAKKTMTKTKAKKLLGNVPDEKCFWSCDGQLLKNMAELETSFKDMSPGTFYYHVNESKNDFGNWVRDVIGDEKLAKALQKSETQAQAAQCVSERISELKLHIKTK